MAALDFSLLMNTASTSPLSSFISKKSLNLENSGELWRTLENSGVLKVQRFFADVDHATAHNNGMQLIALGLSAA